MNNKKRCWSGDWVRVVVGWIISVLNEKKPLIDRLSGDIP